MRENLGEFEELVLLCVGILHGDAYGLSVRTELDERAGRSVTLGAVHATLYRLEDKGYLRSELGGATEKRGGRRKRIFALTNAGIEALRDMRKIREEMWALVPRLHPELS